MKNFSFKNFIAILIFMAIIAGPMIAWNVILYKSKNDPTILQNFDFDLGEKRLKATLSETLNIDNITSELEDYYNDRIPFRSIIINFKTISDSRIEKPYRDVEDAILTLINGSRPREVKFLAEEVNGEIRYYMDDAIDIYYNHGLTVKEFDPYNSSVEYPVKYTENGNVIIGQSNWLYLNSFNMDLYTGKMSITHDEIKKYVSDLENLNSICNHFGKELIVLICPEKEEIYPEYMPYMDIKDDVERTIKIRDYIATNSNLKYVYPKEELVAAKGKYLVYRKYDSHWNYVGGYIASKKVLDTLGIDTIPLREIPIIKVDMLDFELVPYGGMDLGTLPRTFEYQVFYKPDIKVTQFNVPGVLNKVSIRSESDSENKDRMFLIGDSFSHALIQYLHKEFKEFYFNSFTDVFENKIDYNYLKNEIKNSDVLMIELVERNDPNLMSEICFKLSFILEEIYGKSK